MAFILILLFSFVSLFISLPCTIGFSWSNPSRKSFSSASLFGPTTSTVLLASAAMASSNYSEKKIRVVGICGGIGSGKSAACKLMVSDLGCSAHIDADSIAHTMYEPGSQAVKDVVNEFGSEILQDNGEIDRQKLGSIVFADRDDMKRLERIVWPHVRNKVLERIREIESSWKKQEGKIPIVILEAAVLLDAEWDSFLDALWVVTVSQQVALERLMANRGLTHEEAEKRIAAQESRRGIGNLDEEVAKKVVTSVVDNSGSLKDLKQALLERLSDPDAWYPEKSSTN